MTSSLKKKKRKDKRRIVDAPTSSWSYLTSFSIQLQDNTCIIMRAPQPRLTERLFAYLLYICTFMHCSQLLSKIGSVSLFSLCCVSSRHRSMEDRERRRVTLSDRNPFKRPAITSFSLSVTFVQNLVQTLNTKASDVLQKKRQRW